ncbi:MAG TPA: ABC transporter permease [Gammaproteobacteria bacterium]|nr:ABC transporter permease [Gammaproteobacteria bacterium]
MLFDLRFAARSLLRTPGFTLLAALTLAIGIGATTTIFSLVNTVLLQPLPYARPDELARIYTDIPTPGGVLPRFRASTTEFRDLRRDAQSWQSLDAWRTGPANVVTTSEPLRVNAAAVTGGLIPTLGVPPVLGRLIEPQDDELAAPLVALISHRLWQTAFGGDRAIVGRDLVVNGAPQTIVGVMPEGFEFPIGEPDAPDIWTPLRIDPAVPVNDHSVFVLGRLKPGVPLPQAQAELDALVARAAQAAGTEHHLDPREHRLGAYALHDEVVLNVRPALRMLFGAVCFLLLIACVNVANLLLTRAEARQREIAVRSALGAGLPRLALQFSAEGVLLSLFGAAFGVVLAKVALLTIGGTGAVAIPRAAQAGVDARVLAFAVATALVTGLLFGLAPLLHVAKRNLHAVIRAAGAATTAGVLRLRLRHALIVGQLALALILLAGTGLMLRTFWNLARVDTGFDTRGITTMQLWLRQSTYDGEAARALWTRLGERVAALPGVDGVALTSALPPVAPDFGWGTQIDDVVPGTVLQAGRLPTGELQWRVDHYQVVSAGYFDTLTIDLVAGRLFDGRDDAQAPRAVIVNEALARAAWGDGSALGRRIVPALSREPYLVVGVISDVKNRGVDRPADTALYLPYTQVPAGTGLLRAPYVAVRAAGAPDTIVRGVRGAVRELDPSLPLAEIRSLDDVVAASETGPRFMTLVLTLFGGVSLLLAAVGIYGVIAYSVAQRTRELGIRIALGAQARGVLGLVLRGALLLAGGGVLLGLVGAFALTRFLSAFLFGVGTSDPATFAAVSVLLAVVALLASYVPARRATRVDPLAALRTE